VPTPHFFYSNLGYSFSFRCINNESFLFQVSDDVDWIRKQLLNPLWSHLVFLYWEVSLSKHFHDWLIQPAYAGLKMRFAHDLSTFDGGWNIKATWFALDWRNEGWHANSHPPTTPVAWSFKWNFFGNFFRWSLKRAWYLTASGQDPGISPRHGKTKLSRSLF